MLTWNLSADATDQPIGLTPDPFMWLAHSLAILDYLLRISSVEVHQAMSREDRGEANQECNQANVYPAKTHGITSI